MLLHNINKQHYQKIIFYILLILLIIELLNDLMILKIIRQRKTKVNIPFYHVSASPILTISDFG